ncbi:pyridoxamine 5'-phosphate oxidase family protein [Yoonia sp. 208BN28-4]|uniref:pyridoxamine 5'-phosphate oxidase family protein n=1 Tax=Yoonia sp. 208BN28-4 TaxID=3126505 RepID=UPI0030A877D7
MNDWLSSLDALFEKVWDRLETGGQNADQVAFATVGPNGMPENRTVVLRHANRDTGVIEIYTDIQSDKIASLRANPQAAVLLWDADLKLQIRLQAKVEILTGETTKSRWDDVPQHSRASYGVTPAPGTVIEAATSYEKLAQHAQFAVMRCTVETIDAVSLHTPHQRAAAHRAPSHDGDWVTNWLVP